MDMRTVKSIIWFSLMAAMPLHAADPLGGRSNVMDCSHDEVVAYMELPEPERRVMHDYKMWEKAYQSTEIQKSLHDPSVCLSLLYGDLEEMAERLRMATDALSSMSLPSMSTLMSKLGDKLMEGICSRVEAGKNEMQEQVVRGAKNMRDSAHSELKRRYGQRAMEKYLTDAVVAPEYQSMGLRYRNGEIDKDSFQRGIKKRWTKELDGLEDSVTGG